MRHTTRILVTALALGLAGVSTLTAQEYIVVVNDAVPLTRITPTQLAGVFEKRLVRWAGGLATEPVDQSDGSSVRERFNRDVLAKSTAQVRAFWQTQVFAGRGVPPLELATDQDVLAYVQSHAGAIGYVTAGVALPEGVRRLRVGTR